MKAQALLPVLPWTFDCDSGKFYSKTPVTIEDGLPFINSLVGSLGDSALEKDGKVLTKLGMVSGAGDELLLSGLAQSP